ncbi:MAG: sensor histidine kinase [Leptospirales bacterium]|nr:sensor histidine kinase [Leptospirales bacterium]
MKLFREVVALFRIAPVLFGTLALANQTRAEPAEFLFVVDQCRLSLSDKTEHRNPDFSQGQWEPVQFPERRKENGIVWYGCTFEMPEHPADLMVVLHNARHADEVFVNGRSIGGTGDIDLPGVGVYREPRAYMLPVSQLLGGTNTLAVRVRVIGQNGGLGAAPEIRKAATIATLLRESSRRGYEAVIFSTVYMFVACYFFYVWSQFRSKRENLFFALFCATFSLYLCVRFLPQLLASPSKSLMRIELCLLFLGPPMFMRFLYPFLARKTPRALFAYDTFIAGCIIAILALADPEDWRVVLRTFQYSVFPLVVLAIIIVGQSIAKGNNEAKYIAGGFALASLTVILDLLSAMRLVTAPTLVFYGFSFLVGSIALVLADRFVRLYHEQAHRSELLRDLDRRKTDFLSNISHEIKTPLAEVMMYAESLADGTLQSPEEIAQAHAEIKSSAARLQHVVSDTVLLNLLEKGMYDSRIETQNLHSAVADAIERFHDSAGRRHVQIRNQVSDQLRVLCDGELLARALENLIENGILYNRQGGQLIVEASEDGDCVVLTVQDEGTGIEEDVTRHLFQKFVRGDSSTTYAIAGTGTGLALASLAAKNMGGELKLLRTGADGTVFALKLRAGEGNV